MRHKGKWGESIPTQWIVISGAPCSGKTSVWNELLLAGYKGKGDLVRDYILRAQKRGITLEQLRANDQSFQINMARCKALRESHLNPKQTIVMDNAVACSRPYFRLVGLDPSRIDPVCSRFRYKHLFIMDRLPVEKDGVRKENDDQAAYIDTQLEVEYTELGYKPIRIPVMPIAERVSFILDRVNH